MKKHISILLVILITVGVFCPAFSYCLPDKDCSFYEDFSKCEKAEITADNISDVLGTTWSVVNETVESENSSVKISALDTATFNGTQGVMIQRTDRATTDWGKVGIKKTLSSAANGHVQVSYTMGSEPYSNLFLYDSSNKQVIRLQIDGGYSFNLTVGNGSARKLFSLPANFSRTKTPLKVTLDFDLHKGLMNFSLNFLKNGTVSCSNVDTDIALLNKNNITTIYSKNAFEIGTGKNIKSALFCTNRYSTYIQLKNISIEICKEVTDTVLNTSEYTPSEEVMNGLLSEKEKIHPRIYIDNNSFNELKSLFSTEVYKNKYENLCSVAEKTAALDFTYTLKQEGADEEQRPIGDNIALFAAAYRFTQNPLYLQKAEEWCLNACGLDVWGIADDDLAAGHILFGMALCYDWLYDDLSDTTLEKIRTALLKHGTAMHSSFINNGRGWTKKYIQNHGWINLTGLSAAAIAIYDEYPECIVWLKDSANFFSYAFTLLPPDGASQEGVGYWSYGIEWLLKYARLARDFTGVDVYKCDWLKNTGYYRLYMSDPEGGWSAKSLSPKIADAHGFDYSGSHNILYHLAAEYNNGHFQYLADKLENTGYNSCDVTEVWTTLLWYNPKIRATSPIDLDPGKIFEDMGLAALHSGWNPTDSALYFRCGPHLGHHATNALDLLDAKNIGEGHVHPDNNSFILHSGDEVLIRDDGYVKKATSGHNTLLINGKGQLGEGGTWFNAGNSQPELADAFPRIVKSYLSTAVDYVVADAHEAYHKDYGLTKFRRHFIFLKKDSLVIIDEVETSKASDLELRFFPQQQTVSETEGGFKVTGGKNILNITSLTDDVVLTNEKVSVYSDINGNTTSRQVVNIKKNQAESLFSATAFNWAPYWDTPPSISMEKDGSLITLSKGNEKYVVDLQKLTVTSFPHASSVFVTTADGVSVTDGCTISREISGFTVQHSALAAYSSDMFSLKGNGKNIALSVIQSTGDTTELLLLSPINPGKYSLSVPGKEISFTVDKSFAQVLEYDFSAFSSTEDFTSSAPAGWDIHSGGGTVKLDVLNGNRCLIMAGSDARYTTPIIDIPIGSRTEPFMLKYSFSTSGSSPQPYFELHGANERRFRFACPWRRFAIVTGYNDNGGAEDVFCDLFGKDDTAFKLRGTNTHTVEITIDPMAGTADFALTSDALKNYTGPKDPRVVISNGTATLKGIPLTGESIGIDRLRIGMVPNGSKAYMLGVNKIQVLPAESPEISAVIRLKDNLGRPLNDIRNGENTNISIAVKNFGKSDDNSMLCFVAFNSDETVNDIKVHRLFTGAGNWGFIQLDTDSLEFLNEDYFKMFLWRGALAPIILPLHINCSE